MLWGFNIEKAVDAEGNVIVPDPSKLDGGGLVQPAPFPAKITPRTEKHAQAIRDTWASDQQLLDAQSQWKEIPEGMKFYTYDPVKE